MADTNQSPAYMREDDAMHMIGVLATAVIKLGRASSHLVAGEPEQAAKFNREVANEIDRLIEMMRRIDRGQPAGDSRDGG